MPYDNIRQPVRPTRAHTPRPPAQPAPVDMPTTAPAAPTTPPPARVAPPAAAPTPDMTQIAPPVSAPPAPSRRHMEPPRMPQPEPVAVPEVPKYILPVAAASIPFAFCCLIGGIVNLVLELAFVRPKIAEYKAARQPVPGTLKSAQILNWIGIGLMALSGIWLVIYCIMQAASSSS